ncbi:ubiquinol-cytochrome c reductase complex ubiquinone-binding protein [Phlyctema vagabunda]|uniref:Cytochrome b-c1 complex subunit 8 n=1 Tax=Phlyctema vagabunda TaxID=108571 RepID=A0ABR4PLP5_9HELO
MEYNPNPNTPPERNPVLCWGHNKIPKQKGIAEYRLSSNRQRPLAGAMHNAVFNTARRCRGQFLYVVPPFLVAYLTMTWAEEKYGTLTRKARFVDYS